MKSQAYCDVLRGGNYLRLSSIACNASIILSEYRGELPIKLIACFQVLCRFENS